MRCFCFTTTPCITVSIITVVVRLSRLAEMTNVRAETIHSMRLLWRVRISRVRKSKQPLFTNISVIAIVESRNNTTSEALPTYLRKMFCAMKFFTSTEEEGRKAKKLAYSEE